MSRSIRPRIRTKMPEDRKQALLDKLPSLEGVRNAHELIVFANPSQIKSPQELIERISKIYKSVPIDRTTLLKNFQNLARLFESQGENKLGCEIIATIKVASLMEGQERADQIKKITLLYSQKERVLKW